MRRHMSIRTIPSAMLALGLFGSAANAFEYRQIDGWSVSCDNAYVCTISFNPPASTEQNDDLAAIQWHRNASPSSPLTLSLPYPPGFYQHGDAKGAFQISVDGHALFSAQVANLSKDESLGTFGVNAPDELALLFGKMVVGTSATISYKGNLGDFSATIAPAGLRDGARFLDDVQGRAGRADALVEKGEGVPPEKINVWPVERYDQLPQSVLRNLSDTGSACYTDEIHLEQADAFGFDTGASTLLLLPCGPSGAYNQPYQLFVGKEQDFHRTAFPNVSDAGITVLDTIYNVNFDLRNRRLSSVYLGRGLGDCGLAHYWSIDEKATGNPLVLTHERAKSACDGEGVGANSWPVSWQSEVGHFAEAERKKGAKP